MHPLRSASANAEPVESTARETRTGPYAVRSLKRPFRADINGLRAIAVAVVVLYHFHVPGFEAGYVGVDVFFVISGFLMTRMIFTEMDRGQFSILEFYYARLSRIFPALLTMVTVCFIVALAVVPPARLIQMSYHALAALSFISNALFWAESGYFDIESGLKYFLHTWSLSVEWQFYIVYPVVLSLLRPLLGSTTRRTVVLLVGAAASLALSVIVATLLSGSVSAAAFSFYMLPTRAWEMIAGALLAVRPDLLDRLDARLRHALEWLGYAGIGLSVALFSPAIPWPSYNALLPVLSTSAVILANVPRPATSVAAVQMVGKVSYSVYLWHWPIVVSLNYLGVDSETYIAFGIVLSFVVGYGSYVAVEQTSSGWLRRIGRRRGTLTVLAAGAVLSLLPAALIATHGLPSRIKGDRALHEDAIRARRDGSNLRACDQQQQVGRLKACVIGTESTDDVLVLGDSFATMWLPRMKMLEPKLDRRAVVLLAQNGCPPIPGFRIEVAGYDCPKFLSSALTETRKARYRTILLIARWPGHFFKDDRSKGMVCRAGACVSSATEAGVAAAKENLADLVALLRDEGKRVVVVTTSPHPLLNVPFIVERRTFQGVLIDPSWSYSFSDVLAHSATIDTAIKTLSMHGAEIVDLNALLCPKGRCPMMLENRPMFMDTNHLRASAAARIGDFLDPYLVQPSSSGADK